METSGNKLSASQLIEVFIAYSHDDSDLQQTLIKHLASLKRQGIIEVWYDAEMVAGTEWQQEIHNRLERANLILLLVSASFIASDYCYGIEMRRAIERHQLGDVLVIPVILRETDWKNTPLGRLQALPRNGKPVTSWLNQDEAMSDIVRGIRKAIVNFSPHHPGSSIPLYDLLADSEGQNKR